MKKIIIITLVALLAGIQLQAQFTRASLQASGLTCSMCNNAIYKALKALPFVAAVESNIKNASFEIVFKENTVAEIDALKDAVEDAGFSVAAFTLSGNFEQVAIGNDKHVVIGDRHFHFLKVSDRVLNGEQTITVVDKGFLTAKNFRKYSAATTMACMQTGKAGPCCEKDGVSANTRVYHVTI
jgi:copper chaperone CopZ